MGPGGFTSSWSKMNGKPPKPPRNLDDDDLGLWRQVTKDLKPLPGREQQRLPPTGAKEPETASPSEAKPVPRRPPPRPRPASVIEARPRAKPLIPGTLHDIDKRTADRLKRGKLPVEARLDLHGLTQVQAERALARFLAESQSAGLRNVLLITGKGRVDGGVLRRELPYWLNQPRNRDLVVAVTPAQPKDGGEGAFYLRLKRLRERG